MARRKPRQEQSDETLINLADAQQNAQSWLEENQTKVLGGLVFVLLLVGGYLAYQYFYKAPRAVQAQELMYKAEQLFAQDSFAKAIQNPGEGHLGFYEVASQYGSTPAGNLANYYAAICHLNLGDFDVALDYLGSYSPTGEFGAGMKYGSMADAYSELNKMDQAAKYYAKAANANPNDLQTPIYLYKLALLQEVQGDKGAAKSTFERIKKDYPNSQQGRDADKYISRLSAK